MFCVVVGVVVVGDDELLINVVAVVGEGPVQMTAVVFVTLSNRSRRSNVMPFCAIDDVEIARGYASICVKRHGRPGIRHVSVKESERVVECSLVGVGASVVVVVVVVDVVVDVAVVLEVVLVDVEDVV